MNVQFRNEPNPNKGNTVIPCEYKSDNSNISIMIVIMISVFIAGHCCIQCFLVKQAESTSNKIHRLMKSLRIRGSYPSDIKNYIHNVAE